MVSEHHFSFCGGLFLFYGLILWVDFNGNLMVI